MFHGDSSSLNNSANLAKRQQQQPQLVLYSACVRTYVHFQRSELHFLPFPPPPPPHASLSPPKPSSSSFWETLLLLSCCQCIFFAVDGVKRSPHLLNHHQPNLTLTILPLSLCNTHTCVYTSFISDFLPLLRPPRGIIAVLCYGVTKLSLRSRMKLKTAKQKNVQLVLLWAFCLLQASLNGEKGTGSKRRKMAKAGARAQPEQVISLIACVTTNTAGRNHTHTCCCRRFCKAFQNLYRNNVAFDSSQQKTLYGVFFSGCLVQCVPCTLRTAAARSV